MLGGTILSCTYCRVGMYVLGVSIDIACKLHLPFLPTICVGLRPATGTMPPNKEPPDEKFVLYLYDVGFPCPKCPPVRREV